MQLNPKKLFIVIALGTSMVVSGITGCHTQGRTAGTYIDDRMVTSKVKGALNDSPIYKYPNVDVSAFNGTVQLNGFVDSQAQKTQAAQLASQVQGVRQLINNITVQPSPASIPTGRTTGYPRQTTPVPQQ